MCAPPVSPDGPTGKLIASMGSAELCSPGTDAGLCAPAGGTRLREPGGRVEGAIATEPPVLGCGGARSGLALNIMAAASELSIGAATA